MASTLEQKRWQNKRQKYGVTPEWFDAQIQWQENRCDACQKPFTNDRTPNVDHKHNLSIKVARGLMCNQCNLSLGTLEKIMENEALFERMVLIIKRFRHYEIEYSVGGQK